MGGRLPVNRRNAGYVVLSTNALGQQSVSDFPSKHRRVFSLVVRYGIHNGCGGHFWFAAPDHAGFETTGLVVSAKNRIEIIIYSTMLHIIIANAKGIIIYYNIIARGCLVRDDHHLAFCIKGTAPPRNKNNVLFTI